MASVQSVKRGRDEFWHGGVVLPQPKRSNSNGSHEDLMALLDRIDDISHGQQQHPDGVKKLEEGEEERLNVVMKSLQDEIDLKPSADSSAHCEEGGDDTSNNGEITWSGSGPLDGNSETTTSVSDVGDLYYDDISAEFCFFADHAAGAEGLGIMGSFEGEHSMADIYNTDVFHAGIYAENNTEVFYGSLWEDDIWQVNANANNIATAQKEDEIGGEVVEFNDVGNDVMRPIQCLSTGEEAS